MLYPGFERISRNSRRTKYESLFNRPLSELQGTASEDFGDNGQRFEVKGKFKVSNILHVTSTAFLQKMVEILILYLIVKVVIFAILQLKLRGDQYVINVWN